MVNAVIALCGDLDETCIKKDGPKKQIIDDGEDDVLEIYGYAANYLKFALLWIITILTLGLFPLILHWYPKLRVKMMYSLCSLQHAAYVLIVDGQRDQVIRSVTTITNNNSEEEIQVPAGSFRLKPASVLRYFIYKKIKYLWSSDEKKFIDISTYSNNIDFNVFHGLIARGGLTLEESRKMIQIYDKNVMNVNPKPILALLFGEALTPFYLFQVFSLTIWYMDNYELYASVILLLSVASITLDIYQIRKQENSLRVMISSSNFVDALRNNEPQKLTTEQLVPGDVFFIPPNGCVLYCDAILMNGTAIVNESMLTGECVPVTKVSLPDMDTSQVNYYRMKDHSRHTLYSGTEVLQTRYYSGQSVKAIVLRTSFSTLKGQLVRSIMFPKPIDFTFTEDAFKFLGFLALIASVGFLYSVVIMVYNGASLKSVVIRSLDIITIVVPPALPAAMSIGILSAQMRLKKRQIFCISPSVINSCGAIDTVCFDKTGTLTEDGLGFHCLRPVRLINDQFNFDERVTNFKSKQLSIHEELIKAISSCHSLTKIDGKLCGDPLDMLLFECTGCRLEEGGCNKVIENELFDIIPPTVIKDFANFGENIELSVIRLFTFSSELQRMSVIVHNLSEESRRMSVYCKGSPEKIKSLCLQHTIPANYDTVINDYAQHGYRILAIAHRKLVLSFAKSQRIKREDIECNLELLGVIVMENRLKRQTTDVISQLNKARIRTIMLTGDNILTAVSVARECGIMQKKSYVIDIASDQQQEQLFLRPLAFSSSEDMLDCFSACRDSCAYSLINYNYQLAMTGSTLDIICDKYPELIDNFVAVCDVFARMSPDQKKIIINRLQGIGLTVGMCGDGANDCAALKAAHAGISISESEASIAAPFTSKINDIRCVPIVISEGRTALVTSFGMFKYMAGYSLTQFSTSTLLYWINSNLSDFQLLYIDLFLVALIALFFGNTASCEKLSVQRPTTRLLSLPPVLSILGQTLIVAFFQGFVFAYTSTQPWFNAFIPINDDSDIGGNVVSMQGTALFCMTMFQYITLAVVYSKGHPFRKSLLTNWPFFSCLVVLSCVSVYICLAQPMVFDNILEICPLPEFGYRLLLLCFALIFAMLSYIYEAFFIDYYVSDLYRRLRRERYSGLGSSLISDGKRYEKILHTVGSDPSQLLLEMA